MSRRVGFGDGSNDGAHDANASAPEPRDEALDAPQAVAEGERNPMKRLIGGAFLMLWLTVWAMGMLFAITLIPEMWREGQTAGAGFLTIFVAIASMFWLIGFRTLLRIARGEPVSMRNRVRPGGLRTPSKETWGRDDPGRD